jgi:hypothetical protein
MGKQQKYNKEITKNYKTVAASAEEELTRRRMTINTSARKTHELASKIYLQARVGHALAHTGGMQVGSVAKGSGEAKEHDGMACLRVRLSEIDRSKFEKPKSKNFKKMTNPPKGIVGGSRIRQMGKGGEADVAVIDR